VLDNLNPNVIASNPYANEVPADSTASLLDFGRSVGDDTSSLVSWQRDALVSDPFSAMVRDANPQAPGSPDWTDGTVKWQSDPYLAGLPPTPARVAVGPEAFGVGMPPQQRPVMPPVQHAPMVQMMYQAQSAQPAHQIVPGFLMHPAPVQASPIGQHIAAQQFVPQQSMPQQFVPQQLVPQQFMRQQSMPMSPQLAPMSSQLAPMSMVGSTALLLDPGNAGAAIPTPYALARGVDAPVIAPLPRPLPFVAARARRTEIDPLIVAYHKGKKRERRNAAVGRVLMYLMFIALAAGSYAGYLWYKR
jgi:hypothetical protein